MCVIEPVYVPADTYYISLLTVSQKWGIYFSIPSKYYLNYLGEGWFLEIHQSCK